MMDNDIEMPNNYQEPLAAPAPLTTENTDAKKTAGVQNTALAYGWGWFPLLSLTSASGLLLVSIADTLSRSEMGRYEILFWAGLLLMILPAAGRLASSKPMRRERISLVIMLGIGFYLVKILHSPFGFTFSDELVHSYNVTRILETGKLFNPNSILAVTPFYPGLETVTAAVAELSGVSVFSAGVLLVGIARLIAMLSLYLFFEKVGGSARLAGIAALFYATNANFLYWSAQFSYESLALPLAMWILYVAVRRAAMPAGSPYRGLTLIALLGIMGIVITHHLTSYFVITFFVIWTLSLLFLRIRAARAKTPGDAGKNPAKLKSTSLQPDYSDASRERRILVAADLALFSIVATLIWLITVASITPNYLSPVLSRAVNSVYQILSGAGSTRVLFQSSSGTVAPLWERFTGLGSIVLMLLALPFGLLGIWLRYRKNVVAIMLAGAGLAYFATLGLRFSPEAWETGNRASEFLYIGLAFVLALAILYLWRRRMQLIKAIVLGALAIILMGGVISGWAPKLRLSGPVQVNVGNVVIKPQGYAAAQWMLDELGPGNQVATDESNARLMLAYGGQQAWAGKYPDIKDLLGMADFPDWQVQMLQNWDIRYVVVDRRLISSDNMAGYYFDQTTAGQLPSTDLLAPDLYGKFDRPPDVSRLLDSGNIVIYDVGAINNAKNEQ